MIPTIDFTDSTELLDDPAALRKRARDEGYLFFRGLLPEEALLEVRHHVMRVLDAHGWLEQSIPIDQGVLDQTAVNLIPDDDLREDIGISIEGYGDVQRIEDLHRVPHHPTLMELYRVLCEEDVFVHPRHIVRVMTTHRALTPTPAHQDFPLIQGTSRTWTCWIPLGDCPVDAGPLSVLRRSHVNGLLPVGSAKGAGGIEALLCDEGDAWCAGGFRCGDVLTFPAHTVHRALPTTEPGRVRLSMDVRYQPVSEPVDSLSLGNHAELPWEAVYAGWQRDDLQFYWRSLPLTISELDESLLAPGRRIC